MQRMTADPFQPFTLPESNPSMNEPKRRSERCGITESPHPHAPAVGPSAFAVLRLIASSNLVGCRTGREAGLVPLRIPPV